MVTDLNTENYQENLCAFDFDSNYKPELKIKLLNQWSGADISSFHFILESLKNDFTLKETKDNDYQIIIDGVFGNKPIDNPDSFKIFFTGESKPAKIKGYDLSLGFDYLKEDNYIRYPLYYKNYGTKVSSNYTRTVECNPNKEYFACFLVSNAKTGDAAVKKTEFFRELSKYKEITSDETYLNSIESPVAKKDTSSFLSKCKFNLAFENNFQHEGYMTEKLFQAYFADSIPLYSSHPEAQNEVNKKAFISRQDFKSDQEMIEYIKVLDQDNKKYYEMWNQKIITNPERDYAKLAAKIKDFIYKKFIDPYYQKMKYNSCKPAVGDHIPALNSLDPKIILAGQQEMSKHSLIIAGITRDNTKSFLTLKTNFEHISSYFKDYRIILFENDSKDGTKEDLSNWSEQNPKVKILTKDYGHKKRPSIAFLAEARNYYLEELSKNDYESFDIVMIADMDMNRGYDMRGIIAPFANINNWDVSCANGVFKNELNIQNTGAMYDAFPFRNKTFPYTPKEWETICKAENHNNICTIANQLAATKKYNSVYFVPITKQIQQIFLPTAPLVEVDSCFGGLAFYKKSVIGDCRYKSIDEDCEHVQFNYCMKQKNGARIFFNPSLMYINPI